MPASPSQGQPLRPSKRADLAPLARDRRREFLQVIAVGAPTDHPSPGFEPGNSKTGQSSAHYEFVYVWNIPPVRTCPGASEWCLSSCYNGQDRPDIYRVPQWWANLDAFLLDSDGLFARLCEQLYPSTSDRGAVRVHSAGDFFSAEYVAFWHRLAVLHPRVTFWAYTRSWRIPHLLVVLEELRSLDNFQLFASWDSGMSESPPPGWRLSLVKDRELSNVGPGQTLAIRCPEELSSAVNCASCRHCLRDHPKGVWFSVH